MMKMAVNLINSLFMPSVNERYVATRLCYIADMYGISIGETSLSFREYDPIEEYQYPLKGSESTENHIKYKDIALISERFSFWDISLWNGYVYSLSKSSPQRLLINTHRDLKDMSYFAIKRSTTPQELSKNMD